MKISCKQENRAPTKLDIQYPKHEKGCSSQPLHKIDLIYKVSSSALTENRLHKRHEILQTNHQI